MSYDFTAASDFLQYEAGMTPEEFLGEIEEAMHQVALLRNKRNGKVAHEIYTALLTCADFIERITPKEVKQAI